MIIPKDAKDVKGFRDFFTNVRSQACSLAATYTGPLKAIWDDLTAKFDAALAALPKDADGNWNLTDNLDCFFSCLASANAVASQLSLELSKANVTMASIATTEVNRLIAAGDLIPKDKLAEQVAAKIAADGYVAKDLSTQLCSQAKLNGIEEGKLAERTAQQEAAAKVALIETRKTGLTTAGLPLPEESVAAFLGDTEENFNKAKTTFEARREDLKKAGITLAADLLGNLWLEEARYGVFATTVKSIPALKMNHEPLAPGDKTEDKNQQPVLRVVL